MSTVTAQRGTVAVVGSGAAGLGAAFRLHEAGYRVRLLERGGRLGGRMHTVERDGFLFEEGPSGLTRGHTAILGVVHDAGLDSELVAASSKIGIADEKEIHYLDASRIVSDAIRTRLVSARAKLSLTKLVVDLMRYRKRLDVEDLSKMSALDHLSAEQYARGRYGDEAFERVIDPCVRPLVIGHSDDLSAADLLYVFSAFMADQDFVAFRGGMGSYPRLLAPRFDVTLRADVIGADERDDSVEVAWRDARGVLHEEQVAGVVLACDAAASARIHGGLDAGSRAFLDGSAASTSGTAAASMGGTAAASMGGTAAGPGVRYRPLVHVNLALREAPDIPACYVFPIAEHHPRLVGVCLEHNKVPGRAPDGKGVVGIYPTPRWSDELAEEPDDVITKFLVEEAEEIVPGLAAATEFSHLARVSPAVMNSRPGYWSAMAEFRARRAGLDRRIQLAGDYFCTSSVNAATASGERAARDLLTAIG